MYSLFDPVMDETARLFKSRLDLMPAVFQKLNGLELDVCEARVNILQKQTGE
jgi:hypothetical protein